jgi:two-component system, chemotaxis family, protein-glutamate methylesterase/glutaminase
MTAIHEAGGITIGQDQASSAVYGMPRVCAERGILQWVVPLSQMKSQILQALRYAGKNEQNSNAKSLHP